MEYHFHELSISNRHVTKKRYKYRFYNDFKERILIYSGH